MFPRSFTLAAVQTSIDGLPIEGWGPTDAIGFSFLSEQIKHVVSGDGRVSFYGTGDLRCRATLTVMQTNEGAGRLGRILDTILRDFGMTPGSQPSIQPGGVMVPRPFRIFDPATGSEWSDSHFVIEKIPDYTIGVEPGPISFACILPRPLVKIGALIT